MDSVLSWHFYGFAFQKVHFGFSVIRELSFFWGEGVFRNIQFILSLSVGIPSPHRGQGRFIRHHNFQLICETDEPKKIGM